MNLIKELEQEQIAKLSAGKEIPDFAPGDTVLVNVKVVEGERVRVQAYEGVCIGRSGSGLNENFTVRKISYGEGVERVFPLYSPMIDSIQLVRRGKVRRAKLYYLRGRRGKSARIVERGDRTGKEGDNVAEAYCNLGMNLKALGRYISAAEKIRQGHELGSRQPSERAMYTATSAGTKFIGEADVGAGGSPISLE